MTTTDKNFVGIGVFGSELHLGDIVAYDIGMQTKNYELGKIIGRTSKKVTVRTMLPSSVIPRYTNTSHNGIMSRYNLPVNEWDVEVLDAANRGVAHEWQTIKKEKFKVSSRLASSLIRMPFVPHTHVDYIRWADDFWPNDPKAVYSGFFPIHLSPTTKND